MYLQACSGDVIPKVFGGVKEINEFGKKIAEEWANHSIFSRLALRDQRTCRMEEV